MTKDEHNQPTDTSQKQVALLSCFAVFVILFSFVAGLTGSYIGNQAFTDSNIANPGNTQEVQINENSAVIDVVEKNQDSVVSISISRPASSNLPSGLNPLARYNVESDGSGFVISADGKIVTNKHVVGEKDGEYTIVFNDGSEFAGKVIARDKVLDIAILQIDPGDKQLTPVSLGNSGELKVGQRVVAIGNSLGQYSGTVSYGIISGLSRSIIASDSSGLNSERLDEVIQTDASINPGNSGGPLFDIQGNVIGVNVAVATQAENIGFSIPVDAVKRIISDIEQFGEIRRPYLGIRYIPVTPEIAEAEELLADYGALLIQGPNGEPAVLEDSPAAKAGLQVGDHIVAVNGIKLDKDSKLNRLIQDMKVGEEVVLSIVREGKELELNLTLELSKL